MKLFGWGANSCGQLGLGYKCEQILTPTEIILEDIFPIISICGGAGHTTILNKKGAIFTCGWNNKGQLGKELETLTFTRIDYLCNNIITQISSGWDFNAAIDKNNNIFVWGSNAFLQLGLSKIVKFTFKPVQLEGIKAKYVSCGVRHMAIITTDGKIIVCGNGNKGQLGLLDENGKHVKESGLQFIQSLSNIDNVSCGQNHTLALKSDGTIFCWGNNKHGQLGINPESFENIFSPIILATNILAKKIFTGWTHSAILTQNNKIYTFGRNTYGQLGSERIKTWEPTYVDIGCVKNVYLGSEHNLTINLDGQLLSWGWNEHGNCGTGDTKDVKIPKEIIKNTVLASCGTGQSFAVIKT